jgi:hypothetical protein
VTRDPGLAGQAGTGMISVAPLNGSGSVRGIDRLSATPEILWRHKAKRVGIRSGDRRRASQSGAITY